MLPSIESGSYAFFFSIKALKMSSKHIYKIMHPSLGLIIKRFKYIDNSGYFRFEGDGPESTSSAKIGKIKRNQVLGRLFLVIARNKINFL